LVPAGGPRVETALNVDHVCLAVEARDLSEVAAYLRAQSVEVMGEPAMRYGAHGAGLSIYVRDPEGNLVELKQMPTAP
jgi:glyoxylase I family protein